MTAEELKAALVAAEGVDRVLDGNLWKWLVEKPGQIWVEDEDYGWLVQDPNDPVCYSCPPFLTSDLTDAVSLIPNDFYWTCGKCDHSGHVTIGPDYNGQHRERLLKEWPPEQFDVGTDAGFSADLEPGGSVERVCHAICYALIEMTEAKRRLGI